jgi:hypothetical protein
MIGDRERGGASTNYGVRGGQREDVEGIFMLSVLYSDVCWGEGGLVMEGDNGGRAECVQDSSKGSVLLEL